MILSLLLAIVACGEDRNDNTEPVATEKVEDGDNLEPLDLYADLVTANNDKAHAEQNLAVCEARIEEIDTQVETLTTDVGELQGDKDELFGDLVAMTVEKENAEEQYAVCEATSASTTAENETLNSTIAGLESTNGAMLESWSTCENEKDVIEDEKDQLENDITNLWLANEALDDSLLDCNDMTFVLKTTIEGLEGDIDGFLAQVGGLEATVEELQGEVEETRENNAETYAKYDEVSNSLRIIQQNCTSVECFRRWNPIGDKATGQELIDAMVVEGNYVGRIVMVDETDDAWWTLQNILDKTLWVYEEPPQKMDWFSVDGDGTTVETDGTTATLKLKGTTETSVTINVNGENVVINDGGIAYLAGGGAIYVEQHSDDRAWGMYLDNEVTERQFYYTVAKDASVQNTFPGSFGYRLQPKSISEPLPESDPYYSYADTQKTTVVDVRMLADDGGIFADIRPLQEGDLNEWPFLMHVASVNTDTNEVSLTVFDYSRYLQRGESYQTDTVDAPQSPEEFTGFDGTPTIVVDTACGSLTEQFLEMWEGMDPDVDCVTMEQHIVAGPAVFVRSYFGVITALVTGRDEFELAQAVKMLKGYNWLPSSGSSGGGGSVSVEEGE